MQHYFIKSEQVSGDMVTMNDQDSFHISKVMRQKKGDAFNVVLNEQLYQCTIKTLQPVKAEMTLIDGVNEALKIKVRIIYALPKLDKFEMVIQKLTELGVLEIVPCRSRRSIVKLDQKKAQKKKVRWETIIKEAAEQSRRLTIPILHDVTDISQLECFKEDVNLVAYENETDNFVFSNTIKTLLPDQWLNVFIGPEGGIDTSELTQLYAYGFKPCSLGKRILRSETAPLFVMSAIAYECELNK